MNTSNRSFADTIKQLALRAEEIQDDPADTHTLQVTVDLAYGRSERTVPLATPDSQLIDQHATAMSRRTDLTDDVLATQFRNVIAMISRADENDVAGRMRVDVEGQVILGTLDDTSTEREKRINLSYTDPEPESDSGYESEE